MRKLLLKILKKVKVEDRIKLYCFGVLIFSYRPYNKIDALKRIYDYVKKYSYALDNLKEAETSSEYENCIWQMWWQGEENAPTIVKQCLNSVRHYNPERKVILITEENFSKYLDIPDFILDKVKNKAISVAHFSDYIRFSLLSKYGGTWIDATVLLTDRISDEILSSKFFVFQSQSWSLLPKVSKEIIIQNLPYNPYLYSIGTTYFMHSSAGGIIMNASKYIYEEYLRKENTLIDYFLINYIMAYVVMNLKEAKEIYNEMPKINVYPLNLLANSYFKKFDESLFEEIRALSSVHKLTYKGLEQNKRKDSFLIFLENMKKNPLK